MAVEAQAAGGAPGAETVHDAIARDLAERAWSVRLGFLAPGEVALLAREADELWREGAFREAGVGAGAARQVVPEIRNDRILWLEEPYTPGQRCYLEELERLRLAINRHLYLGLFDFEGHLAAYPPGARYRRHVDQFERAKRRIVSCILYLNEDWGPEDGGELRLYAGTGDRSTEEETTAREGADAEAEEAPIQEVPPLGGTLVTFLSAEVPHEVLPARRDRLSLTGWFRTRP